MFQEPTELLLIGCLTESIWTPKIQINYIDTKNQLADILTKGNFTRDEWNHLLCLFNISHFSSTNCLEVMSKRTHTWERLRPVMGASSSDYSEWNIDEKWSSQVRKSGEMLEARTERPVGEQPAGLFTQHTDRFVIDDDDMDSDTVTESDPSLKSRSFLHRVNDRLRKMLNRSPEDSMQDIDKRSMIWWLFMSSTVEAFVFMGKKLPRQFTFHQKIQGKIWL